MKNIYEQILETGAFKITWWNGDTLEVTYGSGGGSKTIYIDAGDFEQLIMVLSRVQGEIE